MNLIRTGNKDVSENVYRALTQNIFMEKNPCFSNTSAYSHKDITNKLKFKYFDFISAQFIEKYFYYIASFWSV